MPVELEKRQKERLIKIISINVFGCIILSSIIFGYILPTYNQIDEKKTATLAAQEEYKNLKENGVSVQDYTRILQAHAGIKQKSTLSKVEISDITTALKKTGKQENYLDWVNEELLKRSEYDAEIEKNNKIVNDIIPLYSDLEGTKDDVLAKNQMTLSDLINFIEEDILIGHNLESSSAIGFGTIDFNNKDNAVSNIGTYGITLDVTGKNKDLKNLIIDIQKSGNLIVKDGKIQAPTLESIGQENGGMKKFSNLLINMKTVVIPAPFDVNPDKVTTLSLSLQLYVRAQNLSDLISLREQLVQKADALKKTVDLYVAKCDTSGAQHCTKDSYYRAIQSLKANFKEVTDVTKRIADSKKNTNTANVDLQNEFDRLMKLYRDYASIEATVGKHINIIESTNKSESQAKN